MPKLNIFYVLMTLVLLAGAGCQKYAPLSPMDHPAYFRVFNTITNTRANLFFSDRQDELNTTRLICMLIDPQTDNSGSFTGAGQIGDFLSFRAADAAPYESYPNDRIAASLNMEYPGAIRMPVGGVINGLDASRWGQLSAGRHRLVFLRRMGLGQGEPRILFTDYSVAGRDSAFRMALDTTIDLQQGKIYTLDLVSASATDPAPLHLLVRQERWDTDPLGDSTKMYVNFYNYLEMANAPEKLDVYYQWQTIINTVGPLVSAPYTGAPVSYSPDESNSNLSDWYSNGPENFLVSMEGKYNTSAPAYSAIPMPPIDSFLYYEGPALGQYRLAFDRPRLLLNFYLPGLSAATGATPYLQLNCSESNNPSVLNQPGDGSLSITGSPIFSALYQTVTNNQSSHSFAMVNSIFLLNQYSSPNVQRPNVISPLQVCLQRPFGPGYVRP